MRKNTSSGSDYEFIAGFVIDPEIQTLIGPREALARPELQQQDGRAGHISKFYRHALTGKRRRDGRRVLLPTILTGGGLKTSVEAIRWYVAQLNGRTASPATASRQQRAEAVLAAAGIM